MQRPRWYGVWTDAGGTASCVADRPADPSAQPLVASTYLLAGLAGVELGDHQRFTVRWALGSCAVFMVTCLLLDVFPLYKG